MIWMLLTHIRTHFPTCLNIAANSIQVVGESAGGQLALMWAYTKANLNYVKSVLSMYAPTNMNQYGDYLKNLYVGTIWENHTCGGMFQFTRSDPNNIFCSPSASFFPRYYGWDSTKTSTLYNYFPFNCHSPYISLCYGLNWIFNEYNTFKPFKVTLSYNMLQSSAKQQIVTSLTDTTLTKFSPYNALNTTRIVPTFIMHGEADLLVPYNQATNGMRTKLITTGGLINTFVNLNDSVPNNYTGYAEKHLIKTYDNANHSWIVNDDVNSQGSDVVFYKIRQESINWLNGHK